MKTKYCKDWVAMCSNKYFKLTGESPEQSFWGFIASIRLEENIEAFEILFREMEDWFEEVRDCRIPGGER
jgi:hypothetical protein